MRMFLVSNIGDEAVEELVSGMEDVKSSRFFQSRVQSSA